jgi:mannose-6-phosphate isomerase-like protein (cupin superfamily)
VDGMTKQTLDAELCRRHDTQDVQEDDELSRVYFQSPRISFAVATLPAGGSTPVDAGHADAHEVLYCAAGSVEVELGDPTRRRRKIRLGRGDALLIHDGVAHRVSNPGASDAELVWAAAPGWGRQVLPDAP